MKVCLINNIYKPYTKGGAEQIVFRLANWLKHKGHEVIIVCLRPAGKVRPEGLQDGIEVRYLPSFYYYLDKLPYMLRFVWHFWQFFGCWRYWRLKNIIKEQQSDLVIFNNMLGFGQWAMRAGRRAKRVKILHDVQLLHPSGLLYYQQEGKADTYVGRFYQALTRLVLPKYDLVVSPSDWLLKMHSKRNFFKHSPQQVLQNPVPAKDISAAVRGRSDVFQIVYLGQLDYYKGVFLLYEAFRQLDPELREKAALTFYGTGAGLVELKSLIKADGFSDKVHLPGKVAQSEVIRLLGQKDLMVVPSLVYENSPTVIYEAAMAGLPVVASNLGGIPELLKDKDQLFDPEPSELSRKLAGAIKNPDDLEPPGLDTMTVGDYMRNIFKRLNLDQWKI